jgi:hypothetical protein
MIQNEYSENINIIICLMFIYRRAREKLMWPKLQIFKQHNYVNPPSQLESTLPRPNQRSWDQKRLSYELVACYIKPIDICAILIYKYRYAVRLVWNFNGDLEFDCISCDIDYIDYVHTVIFPYVKSQVKISILSLISTWTEGYMYLYM